MKHLIVILVVLVAGIATADDLGFKWWDYSEPVDTTATYHARVWVELDPDSISYIHKVVLYGYDQDELSEAVVATVNGISMPDPAKRRYPEEPAVWSPELAAWWVSIDVQQVLTYDPYFMVFVPSNRGYRQTQGHGHTYWQPNGSTKEANVVFFETADTALSRSTWASIKTSF